MTGRLAGKVAIVTGGNSGMGASTVELFVKEGARVTIVARGEEAGQTLAETTGLKRAGSPEDIAYAALYLASDESLHTTGLNLLLDAGLTCHSRPWHDILSRAETRAKLLEGG